MKSHPYIRAYMAGVLLPTWFLLLWLGVFIVGHFSRHMPARFENAIIFPMAVVPNLWGIWNVLYTSLELRTRLSIGAFGAILPVILVPAGMVLAWVLDLGLYSVRQAAVILPVAMAIYYLVWKYAIAFFNRIVGLK